MTSFKVPQESKGQRLDLFLTITSGQFSRSRVRQLLDMGKVTVNGAVEYRPNYKVAIDDDVQIDAENETVKKRLPPMKMDLKILYQDDDIVMVDKPSGLKVHPTSAEDTKSLLNVLYYKLDSVLSDYGANLINRIDKDTSGIVVVAISPKGAWFYSRQFAESKVRKEYLALVDGRWGSDHGDEEVRVSGFLRYDAQDQRQVVDRERGEFAETRYKLIRVSADKKIALLQALPTTGRTHQIRVHLEQLGYPIIGDVKYGGVPAPRLMLHAQKISMEKLGGGKLVIESEVPPEFGI